MNKTYTLIALLFSVFSLAQVSVKEINALIAINKATKGEQWTTKWNLQEPVYKWHGVEIKDNKVIGLNLENNNLTGQLPEEIGDLVHLNGLDLFKNHISGVIPTSIGNLKNLKNLNFGFNEISGQIPSSLGLAHQLVTIELHYYFLFLASHKYL